MKKFLSLLLLLPAATAALAQERAGGELMADSFRENGKIYVVVAVILTIFAGIIFYLIRLDRKISRLERPNSSR